MKRRDRRAAIGLESLEGRRVLSTGGGGLIAPIRGELLHGLGYLDLQGSVHGVPTRVVGNPDVGTAVKLRGSGTVQGLGAVRVSGTLHGTGFFASGHVGGTITLAGARGSFTLQLQGPTVGGFTAPGPGTYTFESARGTGAFAHDFGNGSVALTLTGRSFRLQFDGKPNVY